MAKIKNFLFVDFETFYSSEYSLSQLSPPEYILDDRYQTLLMAAYIPGWYAPKIILPEKLPAFLAKYDPAETACCSHNALFDLAILSWRYGWVPARLADTLGMARALLSLKRNSLGAVAKALFGADTKGSTVYKVKGMHAQEIKSAGLWPEFCTYALNDVMLCFRIYMELNKRFPQEERKVLDLVLRTAIEPVVQANVPMLETHLDSLRKRKEWILRECGYDKAALMSTNMFKRALEDLGVEVKMKVSPTKRTIPQFSKTDPFMVDLLEYSEGPDDDTNYQVQTLAAARLSQRSTIEETRAERFVNIAKLPWDSLHGVPIHHRPMLPVPLRYAGAHTHRLSGEWSMNMQNLPRDRTKSRLREALLAPPGHTMITADLAQIEARIVAALCDQGDLVERFRRNEDVYAWFASKVFQRIVTKKTHPNERFLGKTAILGLGYGCGVERFIVMVRTQARQYGIPLEGIFDDAIAQEIVDTYRHLFSRIPAAWRRLDNYLNSYINNSLKTQKISWGPVTFSHQRIRLPNNMFLRYDDTTRLYGPKILENITQALARIVVMSAAVRLADQKLRFVMQSHDELVFIVPDDGVGWAREIIKNEMTRTPEWLPGLPLAVEIGQGSNYGECK
jgi:DNA polymerase family A